VRAVGLRGRPDCTVVRSCSQLLLRPLTVQDECYSLSASFFTFVFIQVASGSCTPIHRKNSNGKRHLKRATGVTENWATEKWAVGKLGNGRKGNGKMCHRKKATSNLGYRKLGNGKPPFNSNIEER